MVAGRRVADLEELLFREGIRERPVAVLDLDAFDANAEDLIRRAAGTPVRFASKSLRVRGLLERVLARPGYADRGGPRGHAAVLEDGRSG